jgi:hypothetical protein
MWEGESYAKPGPRGGGKGRAGRLGPSHDKGQSGHKRLVLGMAKLWGVGTGSISDDAHKHR